MNDGSGINNYFNAYSVDCPPSWGKAHKESDGKYLLRARQICTLFYRSLLVEQSLLQTQIQRIHPNENGCSLKFTTATMSDNVEQLIPIL